MNVADTFCPEKRKDLIIIVLDAGSSRSGFIQDVGLVITVTMNTSGIGCTYFRLYPYTNVNITYMYIGLKYNMGHIFSEHKKIGYM